MTDQQLEQLFDRVILSDCSPPEALFLSEHPALRKYALLWFLRGWDAGDVRFKELVEQVVAEISGGLVVASPPPTSPN